MSKARRIESSEILNPRVKSAVIWSNCILKYFLECILWSKIRHFFQHTPTKRSHGSRHASMFTQLTADTRPFKNTHAHTCTYLQRLSAGCNEMSNQLCQIACLPEGKERGRSVCQVWTPPSSSSLVFAFPFLLHFLQYPSLALAKGGEGKTLFPPRATKQRGASARISRLLFTLASSPPSHIWRRGAYGRSPPRLDPEETDEGGRWSGSVSFFDRQHHTPGRTHPYYFEFTRCASSRLSQYGKKYPWYDMMVKVKFHWRIVG